MKVADRLFAPYGAKRLQDLQEQWRTRLTHPHAAAKLLGLVDYLFQSPVVTVPQVERVVGVSYKTALRYVERLVEDGILKRVPGSDYGKLFVADELIDITSAEVEPLS